MQDGLITDVALPIFTGPAKVDVAVVEVAVKLSRRHVASEDT